MLQYVGRSVLWLVDYYFDQLIVRLVYRLTCWLVFQSRKFFCDYQQVFRTSLGSKYCLSGAWDAEIHLSVKVPLLKALSDSKTYEYLLKNCSRCKRTVEYGA
jgi:hypothetical protein